MCKDEFRPLVSVVIPAFNAAACITRAIRSVQAQSEQSFEIIVVNDASTDDTGRVVEQLLRDDERIRLVHLEANSGPSVARNAGLARSLGRWVALLDADDAFKPERLRTLCGLAAEYGLDAIGDDLVFFDDVAGQEVRVGGFVPGRDLHPLDLTAYLRTSTYRVGLLEALFREDKPVSLLKFVLRRDFLTAHALRYSDEYRYCEDFLFYFDLLRRGGKVALLDCPMYLYTEPLGSISRTASPHSRTVPDRGSILRAIDALLRQADDLSPRQKRLLLLRRQSTIAALRYDQFRHDTRGVGGVARLLRVLPRPGLWFRYGRELRHGLSSRLRAKVARPDRTPPPIDATTGHGAFDALH